MKKLMFLIVFCAMSILGAFAQKTFSGKVIGSDGLGIPGVSVVEKANPVNGFATDLDGNWTLTVPNGNSILQFTAIGMKTIEVAAKDAVKITMVADAQLIEEVVVVGYGSARKIANTSASVQKVGGEALEEKPTSNPFDAIQGKVAGLQVFTSSGEPSEVSSVRLHGVGSLGASSAPLFVLDGVPVSSGTIQSMNPNDFESMQVLKDAAATSIYGARAANGVIYITTKQGKISERANITVRAQYGVSNLANEDYYNSVMNSDQLAKWLIETKQFDEKSMADFRKKYPGDTRWHKYYFKENAPTYQADLTFSGGTGSTRYYISGGLFSQEGLRHGSDYKKYNFRVKLNTSLNKIISVGVNTAVTYDESQSNPYYRNSTNGGLSSLAWPFYSPYDKDGKEYYEKRIPGWNRYSPRYLSDKLPHPYNSVNLVSSGNITIKPIEGLTIRSQVGLEFSDFRDTDTRYPSYASNKGNGRVKESFGRKENWTITNTAEYKFNIKNDHNFIALLGQEFIDSHYDDFSASGQGLEDDRLVLLGNTTKEKEVDASFTEYAFLSYFGQFSYNFKEKYFVDLTLREDTSSRFGKNNKSAMFWSTGLLWKAKKEDFLKNVSWLNDLNVKFSIGTSGNASISNYQALALAGGINQYKGQSGWGITAPGNPDLTWEEQTKTTLGFEGRIWKNLGFNLEFYNRLTSNMLMSVPYPYTSGFAELDANVGEYQNRGVDLKLDYDFWKNNKGDYVNGYVNFNYNKDKVISLFQGRDFWSVSSKGIGFAVGESAKFVYPIFSGINKETGDPEWFIPGENIAVVTKDPKNVTSEFSTELLEQNTGVNRYAPINGGWGVDASFKGFYLQSYFSFSYGKSLISNDAYFFENPTVFTKFNARNTVFDYWKKSGDVTRFPRLGRQFTEFDSRMIKDASFMRLKTLTLGYNIPKKLLSSQNIIRGAKVYVSGRNLLTITDFDGVDPEVDSNLSLGANPNTKQLIFGLEINF